MSSSGRRSGCRSMRSEAWLSMAAFVAAAHALVGLVREIGGAGDGVGGGRPQVPRPAPLPFPHLAARQLSVRRPPTQLAFRRFLVNRALAGL